MDGGMDAADLGVLEPMRHWVLVALSTGECEFEFVRMDEFDPNAPPIGACHPCPTPVDGPADYDGTTCEFPNNPLCIYTDVTTQYLDCMVHADGSSTFEWSTSP